MQEIHQSDADVPAKSSGFLSRDSVQPCEGEAPQVVARTAAHGHRLASGGEFAGGSECFSSFDRGTDQAMKAFKIVLDGAFGEDAC